MNKSDGIKVVIIVIALAGAAALIAWQMGIIGGGSSGGSASGGEVTQNPGGEGSDANEELGDGERRTISDGFTPPGKF